jgi:hypothetical protein
MYGRPARARPGNPAAMPVEQPMKCELIINEEMAHPGLSTPSWNFTGTGPRRQAVQQPSIVPQMIPRHGPKLLSNRAARDRP